MRTIYEYKDEGGDTIKAKSLGSVVEPEGGDSVHPFIEAMASAVLTNYHDSARAELDRIGYDIPESFTDEDVLDALQRLRSERDGGAKCFYCNAVIHPSAAGRAEVLAHSKVCPEHPLRELERDRDEALARVDDLEKSLRPVVGREGGESGANVPAPAVPMEGEPGPSVLGAARASMDDEELDSMLQAIVMEVSSSRYNSLYGGGFEDSDEELQEQLDSLRAVARQFIGEPTTPSRWLPPNASDTHAPPADDPIRLLADYIDGAAGWVQGNERAARARKSLAALVVKLARMTAERMMGNPLGCHECGMQGTLFSDSDGRLWCDDHKHMANTECNAMSFCDPGVCKDCDERDAMERADDPPQPPDGWHRIDGTLVHRDGRVAKVGDRGLSCYLRGSDEREPVPMGVAQYLANVAPAEQRGHIGQATLAGYPEPWEDDDDGR